MEENNQSQKHTQIPDALFSGELKFGDKLVYANLKKYAGPRKGEDGVTRIICYPRVDTVAEDCGLSVKTVSAAIKRLEKVGLINITKRKGTSSIYEFPKLNDGFEKFSDEFLKLDISPQAKSYYIELQQHLFLNEEKGTNETTYSNEQIGKKVGLCANSVRKYNTELIKAGMLEEHALSTIDMSGLKQIKKSFDLYALNQAVMYKLKAHEEKISEHDLKIKRLEQKLEEKDIQIEQLVRRQNATDKLLGLQNNVYIEDLKVPFNQ